MELDENTKYCYWQGEKYIFLHNHYRQAYIQKGHDAEPFLVRLDEITKISDKYFEFVNFLEEFKLNHLIEQVKENGMPKKVRMGRNETWFLSNKFPNVIFEYDPTLDPIEFYLEF